MSLRLAAALTACLAAVAPQPIDAARRARVTRPGTAARRPVTTRRPTSRPFSGWRIEHDLKPVGGVLIGAPGQFDAYYRSLTGQLPRHLKVFVAGKAERLGAEAAGLDLEPIGDDFTMAMWSRDYAPFLVRGPGGRKRLVQFAHAKGSRELGQALADRLGIRLVRSPLALEGGNLIADGDGNIFLSRAVLERNAGYPRARIERHLRRMLGARSVTWLEPLPEEVTGHVDIFMKYAGRVKGREVMVVSDSPDPARHAVLERAAARLSRRGYRVLRLMNHEAGGVPFSYAQAVLLNGAEKVALVPSYAEPGLPDAIRADALRRDHQAQRLYRALGYRVIPLRARDLMRSGLGSAHCTIREIWASALED
jgi:agmatine/peptidylarginine deiminase